MVAYDVDIYAVPVQIRPQGGHAFFAYYAITERPLAGEVHVHVPSQYPPNLEGLLHRVYASNQVTVDTLPDRLGFVFENKTLGNAVHIGLGLGIAYMITRSIQHSLWGVPLALGAGSLAWSALHYHERFHTAKKQAAGAVTTLVEVLHNDHIFHVEEEPILDSFYDAVLGEAPAGIPDARLAQGLRQLRALAPRGLDPSFSALYEAVLENYQRINRRERAHLSDEKRGYLTMEKRVYNPNDKVSHPVHFRVFTDHHAMRAAFQQQERERKS